MLEKRVAGVRRVRGNARGGLPLIVQILEEWIALFDGLAVVAGDLLAHQLLPQQLPARRQPVADVRAEDTGPDLLQCLAAVPLPAAAGRCPALAACARRCAEWTPASDRRS